MYTNKQLYDKNTFWLGLFILFWGADFFTANVNTAFFSCLFMDEKSVFQRRVIVYYASSGMGGGNAYRDFQSCGSVVYGCL